MWACDLSTSPSAGDVCNCKAQGQKHTRSRPRFERCCGRPVKICQISCVRRRSPARAGTRTRTIRSAGLRAGILVGARKGFGRSMRTRSGPEMLGAGVPPQSGPRRKIIDFKYVRVVSQGFRCAKQRPARGSSLFENTLAEINRRSADALAFAMPSRLKLPGLLWPRAR